MLIHTDCRHFRSTIPCKPHKKEAVHCEGCPHYDPVKEKILIIKLGAIGDVIRTTPLLHQLKETYPQAQIHWLTLTPDILPKDWIDRIYQYIPEHIETLREIPFDILYNLDKDAEACALANQIQAKEKFGFHLKEGVCEPINALARHKWLTGLFDDVSKANTKSYPQEIFEICGFEFKMQPYLLDVTSARTWPLPEGKQVIGMNTGCGIRWKARLWPDNYWIKLSRSLISQGYSVVFLGGPQEHEKNEWLAKESGGLYFGHYSLPDFIALMNHCDTIVTAVTMGFHIALGLHKKIVLFNNLFNRHEFEMYNRGVILEPPEEYMSYYDGDAQDAGMDQSAPEQVEEALKQLD